MKRLIGMAMLAGAASVATTGVAAAEGSVSANVALTSNYMFRGITQSDGDPAIQGGFDYTNGMFYAGVWSSSVDDFGVSASSEIDIYGGITPTLGPVNFDIGVIGYYYPGASDDIDFGELKVAASINPTEAWAVGVTSYMSDDYAASGSDSLYLELGSSYEFSDAFAVSGAFGNQDIDAGGDYDTWNLGATWGFHGFGLDLRYHDTDIAGLDEEVVFTISRDL